MYAAQQGALLQCAPSALAQASTALQQILADMGKSSWRLFQLNSQSYGHPGSPIYRLDIGRCAQYLWLQET